MRTWDTVLGPVSRKSRKVIPKTPTSLFCKTGFFICCKGNKNKNNCEVSCLETPSFWRYKEYYVKRNAPEKFRDFRETGPFFEYICHDGKPHWNKRFFECWRFPLWDHLNRKSYSLSTESMRCLVKTCGPPSILLSLTEVWPMQLHALIYHPGLRSTSSTPLPEERETSGEMLAVVRINAGGEEMY